MTEMTYAKLVEIARADAEKGKPSFRCCPLGEMETVSVDADRERMLNGIRDKIQAVADEALVPVSLRVEDEQVVDWNTGAVIEFDLVEIATIREANHLPGWKVGRVVGTYLRELGGTEYGTSYEVEVTGWAQAVPAFLAIVCSIRLRDATERVMAGVSIRPR